jgi:alpha-beta hydrolase superfamily lysophospholipase
MIQDPPTDDVRECAPRFSPDELDGFESTSIELPKEDDGELAATLIRSIDRRNAGGPAVLYLHGFVDYFFQSHLALAYEQAGFRFYALELRRYGRSLRPGNRGNDASRIDDYFAEVTWALSTIHAEHGPIVSFVAHSTGALTACLYAKRGPKRHWIRSLALNSPFLAFNLSPSALVLSRIVASLARFAPHLKLPQKLPSTYGRSLHQDHEGSWQYDLNKKPISGFPLHASWFRMIHTAQDEVVRGLDLELPVLTLASTNWERRKGRPMEADFAQDIVLNVEDMRARTLCVSRNTRFEQIDGCVHDLILSAGPSREQALEKLVNFAIQIRDQ